MRSHRLTQFDIEWMLEVTLRMNRASCTEKADFDSIERANNTLKLKDQPGGGGSRCVSKSKIKNIFGMPIEFKLNGSENPQI